MLFGAKTFLLRKRHLRYSLKDEEEDVAKLKGGAEELASAKAGRWGPGSIWGAERNGVTGEAPGCCSGFQSRLFSRSPFHLQDRHRVLSP